MVHEGMVELELRALLVSWSLHVSIGCSLDSLFDGGFVLFEGCQVSNRLVSS